MGIRQIIPSPVRWIFISCCLTPNPVLAAQVEISSEDIVAILNPIRERFALPALAGAIVSEKGIVAQGVVGVRKKGEATEATAADMWHLGSDTKAITAVLLATFVERGAVQWTTPMADILPHLAAEMRPEFRSLTLFHLLSHRSGLPPNIDWGSISRSLPLREQRARVLRLAAGMELESEPGEEYQYSNLGYVVAGAIAESLGDSTWEDLLAVHVLQPLVMTEIGFGGLGTTGSIDQPWPHSDDGKPMPTNGPEMDNPPVLGPAGTIHASLDSWSRFIHDHLRGAAGMDALLSPETYRILHTPPFGGEYALGWGVAEREWGGGTVLTHAGSNTMNYAVVWMSPNRGFAVVACTNQGGGDAATGCDQVCAGLIQLYGSR